MPLSTGAGLAIMGGTQLASSLFGNRGGPTPYQQKAWEYAEQDFNQPMDIMAMLAQYRRMMEKSSASARNRVAPGVSRRLGLDSGAAWTEILRAGEGERAGMEFNLLKYLQAISEQRRAGGLTRMTQLAG